MSIVTMTKDEIGIYWLVHLLQRGVSYMQLRDPHNWIECCDDTCDASGWGHAWFMSKLKSNPVNPHLVTISHYDKAMYYVCTCGMKLTHAEAVHHLAATEVAGDGHYLRRALTPHARRHHA